MQRWGEQREEEGGRLRERGGCATMALRRSSSFTEEGLRAGEGGTGNIWKYDGR